MTKKPPYPPVLSLSAYGLQKLFLLNQNSAPPDCRLKVLVFYCRHTGSPPPVISSPLSVFLYTQDPEQSVYYPSLTVLKAPPSAPADPLCLLPVPTGPITTRRLLRLFCPS